MFGRTTLFWAVMLQGSTNIVREESGGGGGGVVVVRRLMTAPLLPLSGLVILKPVENILPFNSTEMSKLCCNKLDFFS